MDFADILKLKGLEPKDVRLARHTSTRHTNKGIYSLWRTERDQYDLFCRIQKSKNFGSQKYVAHFVAIPSGDTLFTGLFSLDSSEPAKQGLIDPLSGEDQGGKIINGDPVVLYNVTKIHDFERYEGKLLIDWGKSFVKWSQIADRTPKLVTEIKKRFSEPAFPGFSKFVCSSTKISVLPETWKSVLSATRGIYILVHVDTGNQYVGSATGENGFIGRWLSYEETGHGGNVLLKTLEKQEFQIGILEVCSSSDTRNDIICREQEWKEKLGSKAYGLNSN